MPNPRYPFLLVDRVVEWEKEKYAVGYKCVTINDNFFPGHFPERPIMPGQHTSGKSVVVAREWDAIPLAAAPVHMRSCLLPNQEQSSACCSGASTHRCCALQGMRACAETTDTIYQSSC